MIKTTTLILILTIALRAFGQNYEPQILILSPNEFIYEKSFDSEIKKKNKELSERQKNSEQEDITKTEEFKKQPENIQLITLSEIRYTEKLDFTKQASYIAQQYLAYRFYERFENLLILLSEKKSPDNKAELKKISDTEKIQYVLNFSKIELFKKKRISYAKINVQLYDNVTRSYLINEVYEGDWSNPGFEFACDDKSIDCSINNALSKALEEVVNQVLLNSPKIIRERELAQLRYDELMSNYYSKPNDTDFLKSIISQPDSNIFLKDQYQLLTDPNKTKFVAFFIEQVSAQDFKTMKDNRKDKSVSIISGKDLKDPGFLNDIPQTYAYIVKGVKYNDEWYYEKSYVTYFEAKNMEEGKQQYFYNLAKWNFFKENSTELNPDFWETSLFNKIKDLRQDPEWGEYGESIWKTDEINNKPYIGYYEIVADKLKEKKRKENENFDQKIAETVFIPFYESCISQKLKEFSEYTMMYKKPTLIYPEERNVILNPIMITKQNGEKTIRYFVTFKNEKAVYEWTYFKPVIIPEKTWHYGTDIITQLKALTEWNFSFITLDDKNFWDNYILLKSGDNYKYLTKIQ